MSYKLKKKYANKSNYGAKRSTSNIKYIVIHYTANDGDTDEGNANYFASRIIKASAHYFVDDDSVTQSVPDNYVAWSVGGSKYSSCKTTGGGKYYTKCTNSNSISIELCDTKKDGKIYPTKKTIENAIELTRKLMKKYNIPSTNVIRHFDVTGKTCPAYWCRTSENNKLWSRKSGLYIMQTNQPCKRLGNVSGKWLPAGKGCVCGSILSMCSCGMYRLAFKKMTGIYDTGAGAK